MKAIVIREPGGPEVLTVANVPNPMPPEAGEILVRVRATAVNRADLLQRMGRYPAPPGVPADIPGLEYAGEVVSVGDAVTRFAAGDRVYGLVGGGSYAEYVRVFADTAAPIPSALGFEEAATIPESYLTAYDAMVVQAGLAKGECVLVHAVGSGVGVAALRIGKALGARVIGTARTQEKLARETHIGLDEAICVHNAQFADAVRERTQGKGVDVVLDLVGGPYVAESLASLATKGRIAVVGLLAGAKTDLDLGLLLRKRAKVFGTVLRARDLRERCQLGALLREQVDTLVRTGAAAPEVDRTFSLEAAAEAHAYVAKNENFGKVVLTVA